MTVVHLELADGKTRFLPGGLLEGVAFWDLAAAPRAAEVRLFWRTQGKGTVDLEIVQRVRFDLPAASDRKAFRLELPRAPYSFSGQLISLTWGVEAVLEPGGESAHIDVTISPRGDEILLCPP